MNRINKTRTKCISNQPKRYLTVKNCDINNINEDEIWSFV